MDLLKAKVTVTADTGESIQNTMVIKKKSDLDEAIKIAMSAFRVPYREVSPFGLTIRIDHG